MPELQKALRQQVQLEKTEQPGRPIFIGGKSMVGRFASLLVDELAASDGLRGCLCLGYPFNPPGPSGHGREVESYALSTQVQLQWIVSGDHSFKLTKSLGLSEARNWATAVDHFVGFLRQQLNP
jgi:predicted alpha/beta-hydrolase family hydrolase